MGKQIAWTAIGIALEGLILTRNPPVLWLVLSLVGFFAYLFVTWEGLPEWVKRHQSKDALTTLGDGLHPPRSDLETSANRQSPVAPSPLPRTSKPVVAASPISPLLIPVEEDPITRADRLQKAAIREEALSEAALREAARTLLSHPSTSSTYAGQQAARPIVESGRTARVEWKPLQGGLALEVTNRLAAPLEKVYLYLRDMQWWNDELASYVV